MAVKTEIRNIGDHEYSITQWNATEAMVMKLRTLKILGPLFTESFETGSMVRDLMANVVAIIERVDPNKFVEYIKDVACSACRDGEDMHKARFDQYFNGNMMEAYKLAFTVLEVNYKDFLESVRNLRSEL